MSSSSQPHSSGLLDRTNNRPNHGPASPSCPPDDAGLKAADSSFSQFDLGHVYAQDPFAYYNAFLHTNVSSAWGVKDDGNTRKPISRSAQPNRYDGDLQQFRVRPVPYNIAVRFANRSNGVPLSTIIEQGSYSTLNSHGSPSSVSQYLSVTVDDIKSPNRYSHGASRSLDEPALGKITEDVSQTQQVCEDTQLYARLENEGEIFGERCTVATPIRITPRDQQLSEYLPTPNRDIDTESKEHERCSQGVTQNIRAFRHDGSPSSSATSTSATNSLGEMLDAIVKKSRDHHSSSEISSNSEERNWPPVSTLSDGLSLSSSLPLLVSLTSEARNRTSRNINTEAERSTRYYPPIVHLPPAPSDLDAESRSSPPFLQPPQSSPLGSEHAPSTTPRDLAKEGSLAETYTTSHRSRDDLSPRYTFDGVPLYRDNAPSLREYDRARDASICSTVSTTYSGTVLGIDLDLQQDYPRPSVARSSPASVWLAPRQTNGPSISRQRETNDTTKLPHSITSSALPILLPLAAASGIVRPNHATPKLSFFSPSGNLIQAESSSSPASSSILPNHSNSSPTTIYHNVFSNPITEPPVRPALIPLTTPPTMTAQLPAHLRHHHNYQHPTHSHTIPQTSMKRLEISPGSTSIKGCGGMVRTRSLQPHSAVRRPDGVNHSRSEKGCRHWCSYPITKSSVLSCLRRPPLQFQNGVAIGRVKSPHTRTSTGASNSHRRTPGIFNPLAGHVLRVCFCQPDLVNGGTEGPAHAGSNEEMKHPRIGRAHHGFHTTRNDSAQNIGVVAARAPGNSRRE